jgi:hypothetical protein
MRRVSDHEAPNRAALAFETALAAERAVEAHLFTRVTPH